MTGTQYVIELLGRTIHDLEQQIAALQAENAQLRTEQENQ